MDIIADFVLSLTLFHDIMRPACAVLGDLLLLICILGWLGRGVVVAVWLVGWLCGWLCFRLAIYHLTLCGYFPHIIDALVFVRISAWLSETERGP